MERCFMCRGPLGTARKTVIDNGAGYEEVCGPKCERDFDAGVPRHRGPRLTTADDLDLAASQADVEDFRQ